MNTIKIFSLAIAFIAISCSSSAQTTTETFKVNGNCGMCKSKIEKAAKEAGAKEATWDVEKKELTVTFKSKTTNAAKIQQKVADVGYDNAGFKATTETYNKLHGCCKYDRSASPEANGKASCCSGDTKCTHDGDANHKDMSCCKDGKCTNAGHCDKACCKDGKDMSCCKDGKCANAGHCEKACCKK